MKSRPWSSSQRAAFEKLLAYGEIFFETDWQNPVLHPRLDALIVGPSGCGKNYLVTHLAEYLEVPVLRVTVGEWIVIGARATAIATCERIRNFIQEHSRGIIHIDELDKARAGFERDWTIAVFSEIFSLLDRQGPPVGRTGLWEDETINQLRHGIWFVGSGTWQDIWTDFLSARIGFLGTDPKIEADRVRQAIIRASLIPDELLRRFGADFTVILPASEEDYRQAACSLGLAGFATQLKVPVDYRSAVTANLGARWLEELFAKLLIEAFKAGRLDLIPQGLRSVPANPQEELPFA